MTAIIGCSVAGVPLLMGDVLESTPAFVAPTDLYIPSVGSVALAEGGAYRPCGLVQKVCLVGPNLVFAWSGDVLRAKNVLEAIRDANNVQPMDYATLVRYLDQECPSLQRREVGLIGLIKDGDNWRMFSRNVEGREHRRFGMLWADGSGAERLSQQLEELGGTRIGSAQPSPVHTAIAVGTALSGSLIMHEVHHLDSLRALYGGAYEVATIDGGVCVKVQDVAYIQWFAQIAEEGLTLQVSRIFRYAYWNDLLIVRTVRFRDGLQATADDGDTYTVIPTLFRALTNEDVREAPAPSLGAPITSHQITFRAPNGEVYTVTRTDFQNAVAAADFEAYAGIRLREIELAGLRHQVELHIADTFLAEASELVEGLIRSLR